MRLLFAAVITAGLVLSSPVEARPLEINKRLLQDLLNNMVSGASMRFHKKWVTYRFPKLSSSGKGRLSAVYFLKNKVKLQLYKLKVNTISFDLSGFPLVKITVRFKRARPAIKAEYKVSGKMVDWLIPDIHWHSPKLEATARLQVSGGKLTLSGYQFRFYGKLAYYSAVSFRKVSFSTVQQRLKPYICKHVDKWFQGPTKQKIDKMLNSRLRQLCGGRTPRNIRLSGGKLRAECG